MDIFRIIVFALATLMLVIVFENTNKEYSLLLTLIASIIIFSLVITKLDYIISLLEELASNAGINKDYLKVLLKVALIAYIIELTKNICIDAGSSSLATKVELAGKISVVILTIPIITNVISVVVNIL